MADIEKFSFTAAAPDGDTPPTLSILVELSTAFSLARSIEVLYWATGHEQTWVGLTRDSATDSFTRTIDLSSFARSGEYGIREIRLVDNTGLEVRLSDAQLTERGFDVTTDLLNPNADSTAPSIDTVLVGKQTTDASGNLHVSVEVQASDKGSGLQTPFIVEFLSPTGTSLQQWASLDDHGHADVDFTLSPFSASGEYRLNTVRVQDAAGNLDMGQQFLEDNPRSVLIDNPFSDAAVPDVLDFRLTAVFDPVANRPKIAIQSTSSDAGSGVSAAYIRLWSPQDSLGANLDKWLATQAVSADAHAVRTSDYLALPADYSPGEYKVGFLMLQDKAGNEIRLSQQDLVDHGLDGSVRVYFPEQLLPDRQNDVHGSDQADFVFGSNTTDDSLEGGAGNDYLYAGKGDDVVDGGSGNDRIVGDAGTDTYIGGSGIDTVLYDMAKSSVGVNLTTGAASGREIGSDVLQGIENAVGGAAGDVLKGNGQSNRLDGLAGNDTLDGGAGADMLVGGTGSDIYYVDNAGDTIVEAATSATRNDVDTAYSSIASYKLAANVENGRIVATTAANLYGNDADNVLYAGKGNNILKGGAGTDTVSYAYGTSGDAGVSVSLAVTTGQATGRSGTDILAEIENLVGSNFDDKLSGNTGTNRLSGGEGNDTLDGRSGADVMTGGLGNDTYYVDNTADQVLESDDSVAGGIDTVVSTITRVLGNYQENLILSGTVAANGTGNAARNLITGNAAANRLDGGAGADVLSAGLGNDILVGGAGTDTLTGGGGNDVFDFNALSETGTTSTTRDVIKDFTRGQDTIDLSTLDANTATSANDRFTGFIAASTAFTKAGQLKFSAGVLYGNTDSDSAAEFSIAIHVVGTTSLSAADIVL